jgi:hypothetical protein
MDISLHRLRLLSPLRYPADESQDPFGPAGPGEEVLACFSINPSQQFSIEPAGENYLGELIAAGKREAASPENPAPFLELPAGDYFFAQIRDAADRPAVTGMALELQKEALWQRCKPEPRLYLRRLYAEGGPVTQLFRPLAEGSVVSTPPMNGAAVERNPASIRGQRG